MQLPARPAQFGMLAAAVALALGGCALIDEVTSGPGVDDGGGTLTDGAGAGGEERATGVVASITDGDTLRLVIDGDELRVRLTGIDTPELQGEECFAAEATDALAALAPVGSRIGYEYDVEARDPFDRELLYLFASDGTFINLALVEGGYARELHYAPNYRYRDEIVAAEQAAQDGGIGLWGACL